jgi:hypothetical protein
VSEDSALPKKTVTYFSWYIKLALWGKMKTLGANTWRMRQTDKSTIQPVKELVCRSRAVLCDEPPNSI